MQAYIDYIRLATWELKPYTTAAARLHEHSGGWRPGRFLQYSGQKCDSMFHGTANQRGQRHYIIQVSGDKCVELGPSLINLDGLYCTRIDLQITVRQGKNYNARAIYDDVRATPGNGRTASLLLSDTGSTVYIGNRESDTFARLYEKHILKDEYVRLEFEIKGTTARNCWESLRERTATPTQLYALIMGRFRLPDYIRDRYTPREDANGQLIRAELTKARNSKLEWLMSLDSAIFALAVDHDTGHVVRTWLEKLIDQIDSATR